MTKHHDLAVFYDRPVDVLHIVTERVPYEGDDAGEIGVEIDYSLDDDRPVGAKVIGYNRYGWSGRLHELAHILGRHLSVDTHVLERAIQRRTVRMTLTLSEAIKEGRLPEFIDQEEKRRSGASAPLKLIHAKAVAIVSEWAINGNDRSLTHLVDKIQDAMREAYNSGRRRELGLSMMESLPAQKFYGRL